MKKILAGFIVSMLAIGLVGCSSGNKIADGVYTAQADDAYVEKFGYGWRDTLTVTYKDGKIADAVFEAFDENGTKKSTPGAYEGMEPTSDVWIPQLSANVKNSTDGTVDVVAGATMSTNNATQLLKAIETEGKAGETIDVSLDAPKK